MLKYVIGLFLALFLQTGHALDLSVDERGILKNLPICVANGKTAHYLEDRETLHRLSFGFAMAYVDNNGEKVILYDPYAMADSPPAFQYWMLRHECAHHTLGHTTSHMGLYSRTQPSPEDQADCRAAVEMVQNGMSPSEVEDVVNTIRNESHIRKHFPKHIQIYTFVPTFRATLVETCVEKAR